MDSDMYERTAQYFAGLVALQTLVFWVNSSAGHPTYQVYACAGLLKLPSLRTLSFKIDPGVQHVMDILSYVAQAPRLRFKELDDGLSQIKSLLTVEFTFYDNPRGRNPVDAEYFQAIRKTFETALPQTLERRILHVQHMPGQSYRNY